MESSGGGSNISSSYFVLKDDSWFSQFRNGSNPWMARYVYALIFLAANLLAWTVRDYGGGSAYKELQSNIPWIQFSYWFCMIDLTHGSLIFFLVFFAGLGNCKGSGCLGADGVLRVSLGCFVSLRIIIHENHVLKQFPFCCFLFPWPCCSLMNV